MDAITRLAEDRIQEAIERGDFDGLPGAGKPLVLEDDTWVPEDKRMGYKILKNAGCIPPELEERKEIFYLREIINTIDDDGERLTKVRELDLKLVKFNMARKRPLYLEDLLGYEAKVIEQLTR